jgi:hypothetical protein
MPWTVQVQLCEGKYLVARRELFTQRELQYLPQIISRPFFEDLYTLYQHCIASTVALANSCSRISTRLNEYILLSFQMFDPKEKETI